MQKVGLSSGQPYLLCGRTTPPIFHGVNVTTAVNAVKKIIQNVNVSYDLEHNAVLSLIMIFFLEIKG